MSQVVFPLAHQLYKSCAIKLVEQQRLALLYDMPVSRIHDELETLAKQMAREEVPQLRSAQKLGRAIERHLDKIFVDGKTYVPAKVRITQLHEANAPKYAVFLRSESGQSARFSYLHDSLESAVDSCRQYAATAVGHGKLDFTYYAVEIKHRVGIERGKPIDEPIE